MLSGKPLRLALADDAQGAGGSAANATSTFLLPESQGPNQFGSGAARAELELIVSYQVRSVHPTSGGRANTELKMARTIAALFVLCAAFLLSAALTASSLTFTAGTIAKIAKQTLVKTNIRPGYVASTKVAKPSDLNIATLTRVVPVSTSPEAASPAGPVFVVATESLRVRASPMKNSRQLFGLKAGTQVTVSRAERGWMLITAGGRSGWVYGKYLRPATGNRQLQAQIE